MTEEINKQNIWVSISVLKQNKNKLVTCINVFYLYKQVCFRYA